MNKVLIVLLILNLPSQSFSQKIDKDRLDNYFNTLGSKQLANGTIAISKGGDILYRKELGFALKESEDQSYTNNETKYRIGSVSKMFTATLIFQLIEEKELRLDNMLSDFIPNIPGANIVTIENLLRHQSGLMNYTDDPNFDGWKYKLTSKEEIWSVLSSATPKFKPGNKSEYSNTNYLLLSYVIEEVCKKPFHEVITERILGKIGLKNTYFENAPDSSLKNSKSYKYFNAEWSQQRETVASNHLGAGALVSSPPDLLIFMDALFSHKLLTPHSLKLMTTFIDEYGMGFFKISYNNIDIAYGHEGRIDEFYTSLIHYPTEDISIAYCTNGILYPRDDIMRKVTDICLNKTTTIPDFEKFSTNRELVQQLAGKYFSPSMQISVECRLHNAGLIVTTQGQDFETKQIDDNYFANLQFGYFFEFDPERKQLIIKETDNNYLLNKVSN